MKKRTLGKSEREVSAIRLGCMGMRFGYSPPRDVMDGYRYAYRKIPDLVWRFRQHDYRDEGKKRPWDCYCEMR